MEPPMSCPVCKSPQDGKLHEGYRHYECGSFSHATGDCLQPSKACKRLADMTDACQQFRDVVLHGIDQFENWQTNAVLGLYDYIIGDKL